MDSEGVVRERDRWSMDGVDEGRLDRSRRARMGGKVQVCVWKWDFSKHQVFSSACVAVCIHSLVTRARLTAIAL